MRSFPLVSLAVGLSLLASPGVALDPHGNADAATATVAQAGASPTEAMTTLDGVFTEAQADRGRAIYDEHCAACHGGNLRGAWNLGPSIASTRFARTWVDLTVADLYAYLITAMPKDDPGTLAENDYADVVAYILFRNGYPAGTTSDIPVEPDAQALISIVGK